MLKRPGAKLVLEIVFICFDFAKIEPKTTNPKLFPLPPYCANH
jgi:hypothetical protein